MIDYLPAVLPDCGYTEIDLGRLGQIVQAAARGTADVVMGFHYGVETGLATARLQSPHLSDLPENVEIAIDRPQTDPRQAPTNRTIQLGGGRMPLGSPERFEEYAALDGVSFGLG